MKKISPNSIYKIIAILFFFILNNSYAQEKKSNSKTLFGVPVSSGKTNPNNGIIRCATTEYEKSLQAKNPKRLTETQFEAWLSPLVNKQKALRTSSQSGGIITIPVVVHVIYNGQAIGVAPNISDAQVLSQITVLNEDFRRLAGTPGFNNNAVGTDTQIQFALAQVDPNGNPTNGIDRVSLCQDAWGETEINSTVKPITIWDPTQYMNMWSVQFADSQLLGYAQFPDASGLQGLDNSGGSANTDGVVSNYSVFGSRAYDTNNSFLLQSPYDRGRTMTHEVGHWLGLRHIWGDGDGDQDANTPDCSATDYCADTPQVGWEHFTCGTFDTCPLVAGNDMPENYMDYTNDACMNIFTQNQKDRMTTIINSAARRSTLKTSTKNSPIALFANDAELKLESSCDVPVCGASTNQALKKVIIYNRGTSNLTAATINYNINGGGNTVYNWNGNLAPNQSAVFSITINATANGTFNAAIVTANGVTDQRASNNSISGSFVIPTSATNYSYTNYVFRLQQDLWGSETTWNLKDGSGAVLYSGGSYTDKDALPLPDLITENWTLPNNKCYTFTINDSQGDGICCGSSGSGYFDIKATDGTLLTSGTNFKSIAKYTFTIGSLGTNEFETSSDIYLFPNPTKDLLNILIPNDFGLPNSFNINNALGQKVSQKEVTKEADLVINTSSLSKGVYFITIVKNGQKRTLKFIKE
ncbi:M43 family zinc metalloprotease [Flavobacterium eburneipallidum]|uniref:M43 family zinc metalloprotease n=1 Tax=Flavobacterium eburneipallidum TaxID=3003263 RepID=UPI002482E018|nr:M43 family zinc metalloprotease [Flavobacterium eburneipallidum]